MSSRNREKAAAPQNRRCVWGYYAVVIFVIVIITVLILEYRDDREAVHPQAVVSVATQREPSSSSSQEELNKDTSLPKQFDDMIAPGKLSLPESLCPRLRDAQREILALQDRILTEWNVSAFPLFLSTMHVPKTSWDLQKVKFIRLLLNGNETKRFVAGFSGSSVTAGHDSYFHEAFPQVFYRDLAPIFASLHINLTVRNHALGNNPCYPYDACIATHMGEDLDLLAWEQSMNCGRDSRPLDTFTRQAVSMSSKPSVLYLLSGTPSWSAADCAKLNITETNVSRLSPLTEIERELSRSSLKQIVTTREHLSSMEFLKDGSERLFDRFPSAAPMGQSLFMLDQYKCEGPYDINFAKKTPGGGAPWHPGMRGHQVRGDALALTLLAILQEAMHNVDAIACERERKARRLRHTLRTERNTSVNIASRRVSSVQKAIANTAQGLKEIERILDFSPTQSSQMFEQLRKFVNAHKDLSPTTLLALLVETRLEDSFAAAIPAVPAHYQVPETNHAPQCHTNYLPREKHALDELLSVAEKKKIVERSPGESVSNVSACWTKELSFFDVNGVLKGEAKHLGYLDRKILFVSHCEGAALSLTVNVRHESPVWLCECQKGFLKYPATMADLIDGAEVFIQPHVTDTTSFDKIHAQPLSLELLKEQCFRTAVVPAGKHLLTIVQKGVKQINLSYVITW